MTQLAQFPCYCLYGGRGGRAIVCHKEIDILEMYNEIDIRNKQAEVGSVVFCTQTLNLPHGWGERNTINIFLMVEEIEMRLRGNWHKAEIWCWSNTGWKYHSGPILYTFSTVKSGHIIAAVRYLLNVGKNSHLKFMFPFFFFSLIFPSSIVLSWRANDVECHFQF